MKNQKNNIIKNKKGKIKLKINKEQNDNANNANTLSPMQNILNSEYNSLLEKEYYTINGNKDMMTIKIYLSNYFRYGYKINKEEGKQSLFNSDLYIDYLQGQLLSYFIKTNNLSSDSENEKRKPSQTSLKSLIDEKIIIKSGDS